MSRRFEVRLAGEGGQGVVLAGTILAEAAVLDGKNVMLTQAYAAQQRGGPSRTEVIISSEEIDYPKVLSADILLALSRDAFDRYSPEVAPGSLIVVDSSLVEVEDSTHARIEPIHLEDIAIHKIGDAVVAAVIALGAIVELSGVVSPKAVRAALIRRAPKGSLKLNQRALREGLAIGKAIKAQKASAATGGTT